MLVVSTAHSYLSGCVTTRLTVSLRYTLSCPFTMSSKFVTAALMSFTLHLEKKILCVNVKSIRCPCCASLRVVSDVGIARFVYHASWRPRNQLLPTLDTPIHKCAPFLAWIFPAHVPLKYPRGEHRLSCFIAHILHSARDSLSLHCVRLKGSQYSISI
jgi:hypothetical protein